MRGERTAMFFYAQCLLEGTGCLVNEAEGVRYLQKSADLGYIPARTALEERAKKEQELTLEGPVATAPEVADGDAISRWKEAADSGDSHAAYRLGDAYEHGNGVPCDDVLAAVWYERSAAKGNLKAQCALGWLLWTGRGTPANRPRAIKLWQQCALLGMRDACYRLAEAYREGVEGKPDAESCLYWAHIAADKGDKRACALLAQCYRTGWGVPRDLAQAEAWQSKAE